MDPLIAAGQLAPDFDLTDLGGQRHTLQPYRGRLLILNFWSAECPWAARTDREILPYLQQWGERVALACIASNAHEPLELAAQAQAERALPLVLLDSGQAAAVAYGAQTTPHFFLIDAAGMLRYQGAYDDVTFRQRAPTRAYLVEAVQALLNGETPEPAHVPPYGCTIVRL